jgi:hypothetical protein
MSRCNQWGKDMAETKTKQTDIAVADFIAAIDDPVRRADAMALDTLFRRVTGWAPVMWGPSMVGYGAYDYTYASGHSGSSLATGFSPRKAEHSIYVIPGYQDYGPILARLGKHKTGKSCLYVKRLSDIDTVALEDLIRAGLQDLGRIWPIRPS